MHQRFASEMRLIGGLKHPNIVVAHDAREVDGLAVLVTEYIDGMTLSEILKRTGRLDKADACEIVGKVCKALSYIDSKGLVHRDIKPSNIMIDADGSVKLLDLGLARLQENEGNADFTATGQAMGTADYVAPEQVNDSRNVDIRSDIYGLGCTFYKLLSGRAPFAGKHLTSFAKMSAHVSETPDSLAGDVPGDLVKLVDKMLEKDPAGRPQTPNDVLVQIEKHARNSDLANLIATARTMPEQKTNLNIETSATAKPKTEGSFFSKHPWVAAIAGGLAAFAFGIWLGVVITVKQPDGTTAKVVIPDGAIAIVDANGNIEIQLPGTDQHLKIPSARVQGLANSNVDEIKPIAGLEAELEKGGHEETARSAERGGRSDGSDDFEASGEQTIKANAGRVEIRNLAISRESPIFRKVDAGDEIDVLILSPTSAGQFPRSEVLLSSVLVQSVHQTLHEDIIGLSDRAVKKVLEAKAKRKAILEFEFHDPDRQLRMDELKIKGVWRPILIRSDGKVVTEPQLMRVLFHRNLMFHLSGNKIDERDYKLEWASERNHFLGRVITHSNRESFRYRFLESGRLEISSDEKLVRFEKVTEPKSAEEKLAFEIVDSAKQENPTFECFILATNADSIDLLDEIPRSRTDRSTGESVALIGEPVITNEDVQSVKLIVEDGREGLSIKLTNEGAAKMRRATRLNLKKKMAIVIEGEIISAPVIQSEINRFMTISGDFTKDELIQFSKLVGNEFKFRKGTIGAKIFGRTKSANNMREIVLAILNYESAHQHLPTWFGSDELKHPMSWRVAILPFLGHQELFEKYNPEEPWDSEANEEVLKNMPDVFRHPSFPQDSTSTNYIGIAGRNGAFSDKGVDPALGVDGAQAVPQMPRQQQQERGQPVDGDDEYGDAYDAGGDGFANDVDREAGFESAYDFGNVTDGLTNTVFVIETKADIPWTKPADLMVDLNDKDQEGLFDRLSQFDYLDEDVLGVGWGDGRISFLDRKKLTPLAGLKFDEEIFQRSTLLKIFTINDGSLIDPKSLEYNESEFAFA